MSIPRHALVTLAWTAALAIPSLEGCRSSDSSDRAKERTAGHSDHEGHGAAAAKGDECVKRSDLDRATTELFRLTCEHRKKTFECDACRYEAGVVRVPASLITGGLIQTARPERRKAAEPVTLTGEIRFDERRVGHVSSQVSGVIRKVHVVLGDSVKTGQALLEIDSVAIGDAQSAALEARSMLELARRNFDRVSALRKEGIASEKELLLAKQELATAEIRTRGASSKLQRLGTDGTRGRLVLRAPMDGTVLMMHAVAGEIAKSEELLVTVGDNRRLWVWADLYERDIAAVKRAQAAQKLRAEVSVQAYPTEAFPGAVDLVSPSMDRTSRTVKVRVVVENADGRLLSGMFAKVMIYLPGSDAVLTLPRDAVQEDDGRQFVFVHHHQDYFVRRPVVVGRTWSVLAEITRGLDPTQTVVTEGAFLLKSDVLRSKMGAGCAD